MGTSIKNYGLWGTRKFFALRKPLGKGYDLFVSAGLITDGCGVKHKTARNGVSKFGQGKSKFWKSFRDRDAIMIDYESIPANTKLKARLPIDSSEALDFFRGKEKDAEDVNTDAEISQFQEVLEDVYHNRWPPFQKFYEAKISDNNERILYAKCHALIDSIVSAYKEKWPARVIFGVYQRIMRSELDALHDLKFQTESPVYFWRVIRNCLRQGIAETLVHDSLGVPREYRVKLTGQIKAFARNLLRKRTTVSNILKAIKESYDVDLAPATIKRLKAKTEDRNVLEYDANGKIWSRQNGLPKITRFLAEAPGEQYQGDFYKLQFVCRGSNGKAVRLWAYVVLDVYSKKVVGWALGEDQSASLAKDAFKMSFIDHCFLPEEIIIDNDKYYQRPVFKTLMRRLRNLGVIVTKSFPKIPTWKAEVESCFAVLQKMHSSKPWYLGEGIRSKNTAGNPPKEIRDELWRKSKVKRMLSVSEMINEFGKMIEEYNYATNDRKKKVAPADTFRMYESKRTIKWEAWMEPLLFWKTMTKKRIKNDGRIDLQIDKVEYCYQVTKAETLWKYKNSDVRMCYNSEDTSKVCVFERGTLKYIGEIDLRMVMTRENKKEIMAKQRRILRDAQQYIKDGRKEDEDAVDGIVGTSARNESLADKIIKRQMKRRTFEREVQGVRIHE